MYYKVSRPKAFEFRSKLEFNPYNRPLFKGQLVISKIMKLLAREKMLAQHSILSYQIYLYFSKHKFAIEVDEKGHIDREEEKEIKRQEAIKKNSVGSLLELILIKKILVFILKLVKHIITLLNQPKN